MRTKDEFIRFFAETTNLSLTDSRTAWKKIRDAMVETLLDGEKVLLPEIGFLEIRLRKERKGRNLQTGEEMTIPAKNVVALKMSKILKEVVNPKKKGK